MRLLGICSDNAICRMSHIYAVP